jgi:hypothetical protein
MTGRDRALLVAIGVDAVAAPTAPLAIQATWVPAVYVPPPLAVPTGLTANTIADGAWVAWVPTPSTETVIETAPDVAGVPGAWTLRTQTASASYVLALPAGTKRWVRLKATKNGRSSAYTAAVLATALNVGDIAANGSLALTTARAGSLILNGGFESGTTGWTLNGGPYLEASTNAAYSGTNGIVFPGNATATKEVYSDFFPAAPGDQLVADGYLRNLGNGANGTLYLAIWFYTPTGAWLGTGNVAIPLASGIVLSGTEWRRVVAAAIGPAGVGLARVGAYSQGQTAGYYCVDSIRVVKTQRTVSASANLVPNANFGGVNGGYAPWFIGWNPALATITLRNKRLGLISGADWTILGNVGVLEVYQAGIGGGSPGLIDIYSSANSGSPGSRIAVKPNTRYQLHTRMANHRCTSNLAVAWFDAAGAYISEAGTGFFGGNGGRAEDGYAFAGAFIVSPANAATALLFYRRTDTQAGEANSFSWYLKPYFAEAAEHQIEFTPWADSAPLNADSIGAGDTWSVVANTDLHDVAGDRRVGLRVAGSGHRVGDQRNMQAITVGSVRSRWDGLSITYSVPTTGNPATVTINSSAATLRMGSTSISYNAASVDVSQSRSTTQLWHLYYLDAAYAGGSRALNATTNPNALATDDGVIWVGQVSVTVPAGGTGSSGSGDNGGGCVVREAFMHDGRNAEEWREGDESLCWTPDAGDHVRACLRAGSPFLARCVRLVMASGSLTLSADTPIDLPDRRESRLAEDMLGEFMRARLGAAAWIEPVLAVDDVGWRWVVPLSFGGASFPAGDQAGVLYDSHNTYKP